MAQFELGNKQYTESDPLYTSPVTGLVPEVYDTVQITSYTANNDPATVVYRTGGSAGTIVATLTITYDGSNRLTEAVRT